MESRRQMTDSRNQNNDEITLKCQFTMGVVRQRLASQQHVQDNINSALLFFIKRKPEAFDVDDTKK